MHHISGCLPVSTMIQGWRVCIDTFNFCCRREHKGTIHTTTGIIWIYFVLAAPEQFMAFMNLKYVCYFSALVSCVEFVCLGLLPPSLPQRSERDVTQTGSPNVRVSVAQRVSCCQEDTLRVQTKVKNIIRNFFLSLIGNKTTGRVRHRKIILFIVKINNFVQEYFECTS